MLISQKEVKLLFTYNDGELFWKNNRANNKVKLGSSACIFHKKSGRYRVCINSVRYNAHVVIFLYHFGYIPKIIDHKDCDKTNNRIENLRECTTSENNCNQRKRKDNRSGIKGISIYNNLKCIHAQIQINGKKYHKHLYPINDHNMKIATYWLSEQRLIHHGKFARIE